MGGDVENTGIMDGMRNRYQFGDLVNVLPTAKEMEAARKLYPKLETPKNRDLARFLIGTGIDLVGRPAEGNILQTVAASVKKPTEQLFKDIEKREATKFATDADLFKTLIEAKGDAFGGQGKTFAKLAIADDINKTLIEIGNLKDRQAKGEDVSAELSRKKIRLKQLAKDNPVGKALMGQTDFASDVLKGITNRLRDEKNPDGSLKYPGGRTDPELLREAYRQFEEFFKSVPEKEVKKEITEKAEGGRIGLQEGGDPMTEMAKPREASIDYDTLRARLPKEITDDIVKLISVSPQALEDFATIATQQDVDQFNKKYSVSLVLPAEG